MATTLTKFQKFSCISSETAVSFRSPPDLIHTKFRQEFSEIFLDKSRFCMDSLFLTMSVMKYRSRFEISPK